ncbi:hypothetical protein ABLE92_09630 [Gordonia sp. VNQ95]|jgi:hypothetical protein|uniref:hypothetical protein n=1 Tax=Gordonia sp. VNQ95 TaxID=3156619 RepID=UPI0032B3E504
MSEFRIPGMSASRSAYRNRALGFLAVAVLAGILISVAVRSWPEDNVRVTMVTTTVAGGIDTGTSVVLNGSEVGLVEQVKVVSANTYAVVLDLDPDRAGGRLDVLTDTAQVSYAPKNLFGISAVVLQSQPGGQPLRDGSAFRPPTPTDATLTTLLRNLSDLQNEAFDPYMSDILAIASQATQGLLPILGAAGQIAGDIVETQVVSPRQTLPQFTQLITQVRGAVGDLLPVIPQIMEWDAPRDPGYLERSQNGLAFTAGPAMDEITKLLSMPELGQTAPLMPVLTALVARIQDTFPDSRTNGIQIATLIEKLRRALPDGPNGPVLTVNAVLASAPGLNAALRAPSIPTPTPRTPATPAPTTPTQGGHR